MISYLNQNRIVYHQVEEELRAKLNFTEYIDGLTSEGLRIEAEKRGINQELELTNWIEEFDESYRIDVMTKRLQKYLNGEECNKMYD